MNTFTHIIIFLLLTLSYASADQCAASITATARVGGSWTGNGISYQIYDITVHNTGACSITTLYGFFGYPSTASIAQAWNYDASSGAITGFGSMAPGATFTGAGFTISGTGTPTLAFNRPTCPCTTAPTSTPTLKPTSPTSKPATLAPTSKPSTPTSNPTLNPTSKPSTPTPNPTSKPATLAPTSKPSTPTSPATLAPTTKPTTPTMTPTLTPNIDNCNNTCTADEVCVALDGPVPACHPRSCEQAMCDPNSQVCIDDGGVARCITTGPHPTPTPQTPCQSDTSVSISASPRANGAFEINGQPAQTYDLVITNNADITISSLIIDIVPIYPGDVKQMWNLVPTAPTALYQYNVSTYGALNKKGASFYGAGFVISGVPTSDAPAVGLVSFTCA